MKTKTSIHHFIQGTLIACMLTLGFANMTFAAEDPGETKELKYQSMSNGNPVFLLELNNSQNAEYFITVSDRDQSVLFSETIEGKNISRSYELDTKEIYLITGTTFNVTNLLTNETTVYKIRGRDLTVERVYHSR